MMTRNDKELCKGYRMWAVMQAEDDMRLQYEARMQDCMELHNAHCIARLQGFYYTCCTAKNEIAQKLKLYPQ
jgi:hypothetical protein